MELEQLIKDTFTAHEHLTPDSDEVVGALQHRLYGGRRHRYLLPVAAAACVAVVTAGALGAATLGRSGHSDSANGRHTRPTNALPRPARSPASKPASAVRPLTMPFDLGWLPPGRVDYGARRINVGGVSDHSKPSFDGEYLLNVEGSSDISIDVAQVSGALDETSFKSGAGRHISINRRPGIESVHNGGPGGYEIYFETAAGVVYVDAGPQNDSKLPPPSAAELTSVGRHVARAVRFPGTTRLQPTFGIGYVPPQLTLNVFDIENNNFLPIHFAGEPRGITTSYEIGSATSQDQRYQVEERNTPDHGHPGREVQGHRTVIGDDPGFRSITVLNALNRKSVEVDGPATASYAQLYKIADGLILPN